MPLLMILPVKGMLNASKYHFTGAFQCFLFPAGKPMFSYEAPPLDLEIGESPSRIFRWGHQMVSGINGLVTVGEYNFILVDSLFGMYMQAILGRWY
jgi:hypothetical protein